MWGLRGVTRVILANNPLSGALILAALYWASPWQGLLGTLGILVSTLTAVIMGQDRWTDMNNYTQTLYRLKTHSSICTLVMAEVFYKPTTEKCPF